MTVLAVDDQPANLRLLDAVLTPRGHRVLTASSGAEALALLDTEDIDLVLLDVVMPEMDGYEVCRQDPSHAGDRVPSGRDDHRQWRRNSAWMRSSRAPTTSSPSPSTRASCWPGWRRWRGSSATTTPSDEQADELSQMEHGARDSGRRAGRRAGTHQPAAPLPVATTGRSVSIGDETLLREPSPRDRRGLHRPEELHTLRRDQ